MSIAQTRQQLLQLRETFVMQDDTGLEIKGARLDLI